MLTSHGLYSENEHKRTNLDTDLQPRNSFQVSYQRAT